MAIKKHNKRSLEEAKPAPAQNGAHSKKPQNPAKKIKSEKPPRVQDNRVSEKKSKKMKKQKPTVDAVKEVKPTVEKKTAAPLSAEEEAKIVAAKKLKFKQRRAKKNENRKIARKEVGQYKPGKMIMTVEQIQLRIDAITSRPELTKTAKRRLAVLRKRLEIAQGTYDKKTAQKPKPDGPQLTPSQKRHGRKIRNKARKLAEKLTGENVVSEKELPGTGDAPAKSVKQESAVAQKTLVTKVKPVKGDKQQLQKQQQDKKGKGKGAKQPIVKKEEPEESEDEDDDDDDEDAEEEEDSDEEVDSSAMNTTVEDAEEDDDEEDDEDDDEDEEEDEDDEEEEEDDDDEAEEEEVVMPTKKIKQEPAIKKQQEKEKKPFVKKENVKGDFKNGPAANGDAADGKKKRFVLFVGNIPYDANAEEIKKHFLTKVGDVANVRIPTQHGTSTPRGFAYVEVTNEADYQKGLSMHNTILKGRKLNVEYTRGGSKAVGNRPDIVSKNKKLHAMRKQGMLAGSRKEGHSRNDRRQKARQGPA